MGRSNLLNDKYHCTIIKKSMMGGHK